MTIQEARWQAQKLADFVGRGGSLPLWFASKGFRKAERDMVIAALSMISARISASSARQGFIASSRGGKPWSGGTE
jgi:hypothetical protein